MQGLRRSCIITKQLCTAEDELYNELYLNNCLAPHNFNILKLAKNKWQERDSQNRRSFKIVYTYEGEVYVKMKGADANSTATLQTLAVYAQNSINLLAHVTKCLMQIPQ